MKELRYGIIGIGNMGSGHIKSFLEGAIKDACLTAVCDVKQDRLDWVRNIAGDAADSIAYFTDYKALLASGIIDAILIATPHYLHPIIAMEAFEQGLHVLSEKPIGVFTKNIYELNAAAKKSGLAFGIMYNQRTDKYYQKMREMVRSGALGSLKRCVWIITDWYRTQAYYNSGGWRATWSGEGGGVLLNQCPHNLDLWQWIYGMPSRIRAFCSYGKYHDIEVEDDVTAYAEYPDGSSGVFITTTGEYPGTNRLEISGSKGKLVYENNTLTYWKLKEDERDYTFTSTEGFGRIEFEKEILPIPDHGGQHREILQNFTDHILGGTPLLAPGIEGINGLSISNAMMLSSHKNDWVDLPNDGSEFLAFLNEKIAASKEKTAVNETVANLEGTYGI